MQVRMLNSTPLTPPGEVGSSIHGEANEQLPWLERVDGPATSPRGEVEEHQNPELHVKVLVLALKDGANGAAAIEQTPAPADGPRPVSSPSCFGVDRFEIEAPTRTQSNLLDPVARASPGSAEIFASSG